MTSAFLNNRHGFRLVDCDWSAPQSIKNVRNSMDQIRRDALWSGFDRAIVVECRSSDQETLELLEPLDHEESAFRVSCERAFLRRLEGGCQLPCGISTRLEGEGKGLVTSGILFSLDGTQSVEAKLKALPENPEAIGLKLAEEILMKGGEKIIRGMRRNTK